jgi:hypothetical protein
MPPVAFTFVAHIWHGIEVAVFDISGFGGRISSTLRPRNGPNRRKMTTNVLSACMCWIPFTR